ncbi:MAG: hypothetical protein QW625_00285 [Candidatus Nanoarchaeia archaeon]
MAKTNLRHYEIIGLFLIFVGATWLGFGFYATLLGALRMLLANVPLPSGKELLVIPLFFGLGAVLLALGHIELKEAMPGKGRKR